MACRGMSEYREADVRRRARSDLEAAGLIVTAAHVDYGGGYHGTSYLDVPGVLHDAGRAWRLAQDLLDLVPASRRSEIEIVAGAGCAGVVFAHVMAGLIDSHRPRHARTCRFVALPETFECERNGLDRACAGRLRHRAVLLVGEWSDAGCPLEACADATREAGGHVVARTLLWGWSHPAREAGSPLITLCDWIIQDRVRDSQCPGCRSRHASWLVNTTRMSSARVSS
jgi:hypothetical protein